MSVAMRCALQFDSHEEAEVCMDLHACMLHGNATAHSLSMTQPVTQEDRRELFKLPATTCADRDAPSTVASLK